MAPPGKSLRVLVCGAGIAGQAAALWLRRGGHAVTVIERFPSLRTFGAQVDLRGQGVEAIRRMGLFEGLQEILVHEPGVTFVDRRGGSHGTILANTSGRGRQSLTSEYEVMRGDLVRLLNDPIADGVTFRFDRTVEGLDEGDAEVVAHFSDGSEEAYDLVIGADGQGSRARAGVLPDGEDPYRRLGIHMAYWFIGRIASDTDIRETLHAGKGRMIFRRSHNSTETQIYFVLREESAEASAVHRRPVADQKAFWSARFRDAGWEVERFIAGMEAAEGFYSQEVVQVRTDTWSKGRVVLAGDAAHCPSPFSGMGTSAALVGAYVLADAINRSPGDLPGAFAEYDRTLRPFVENVQDGVNPRVLQLGIPKSAAGVAALHAVTGAACALRIPSLVERFSSEERGGDWRLPDGDQVVG